MMVTPCGACGSGPWISTTPATPDHNKQLTLQCQCQSCGNKREFSFTIEYTTGLKAAQAQIINPGQTPSTLLDMGQWLGLFHTLLESAASESSPTESRKASFQAVLCLNEAMKFFTDSNHPPQSAFFTQSSKQTFLEHPAQFDRQRLLDMLSRLPPFKVMARRVNRDGWVASKSWWQFWRK